MNRIALIAGFTWALASANVSSRGVSPYLPLNLEPEIERQIERVLILGDKPVMKRPIAAATVLDALPKACAIDPALCAQVRRYLARFTHAAALSHASLEGAATDASAAPIPNRHGMSVASEWQASASAYWQPLDFALLTLGGVAYDDDAAPVGSVLSVGFDRAQLDVGYRGHWFSPFTDSSMLLSTEALTMPSATLSNYLPLTRLGLRYEAFLAEMSKSDRIAFAGGFTSGNPRLFGMHLSMEPVSGWSVGVNRLMQFGGGARGGNSAGDVLEAFFRPSSVDNVGSGADPDAQFGNQAAAFTSQFLFPGRTPFAVYFEYAGEDTSYNEDYRLGNSALSAGVHFPRLWKRFELTYETSEWQNGWYVHSIYQEGLTNERRVTGHWGADARVLGDAVGGASHMLQLGWEPGFGGVFQLRYRTVANESYSPVAYERGHDVTARYSRPLGPLVVGGEVFSGRDVFGENFSRVAAFFRYAPDAGTLGTFLHGIETRVADAGAELFVDIGATANRVKADLDYTTEFTADVEIAPHFAIGARRAVSARSDFGARIELDDVDGHSLIALRAVDYRYRFAGPIALSGFLGAARYDLATPAHGLYAGVGAQWRDALPGWDLALDARFASKVARDDLVAGDLFGQRPDSFYDIFMATLYVARRF